MTIEQKQKTTNKEQKTQNKKHRTKNNEQQTNQKHMKTNKVDIFIPCFIDQLFPETGMNMVKVLERVGVEVNYNPNQTCCGQLAFNGGFWEDAKCVAEKFIKDFKGDSLIVGPSASCIGMIKNYYPEMFNNSSLHYDSRELSGRIYEFTDFLVNILKKDNIGAVFNCKATFHDACTALREYGLNGEPRQLLSKVEGLEIVEMEESDVCCGFGGTFSIKFEPISVAMAQQKVEHAIDTGAEVIISTEASCLMNLRSYIEQNNIPLKTMHIADVLAQGY